MQQDNTIENKLQQLENQRLPDLSQMDAHWAAMEATLQADKPRTGKNRRWWFILAAALLGGTIALFLQNRNDQHTKQLPAVTATNTTAPLLADSTPTARIITSGDTLKLIQPPPSTKHSKGGTRSVTAVSDVQKRTDTVYFNLNFIDCTDKSKHTPATSAINWQQRQEKLSALMSELEKDPDGFLINNKVDTNLVCSGGTIVSIPAGSLGGAGAVQILIKEFYKKSEFALNKLSATSDRKILESGGMLHISAAINGVLVSIAPGFSIRVYMAGDAGSKTGMQLFTGQRTTQNLSAPAIRSGNQPGDTVSNPSSAFINWVPQDQNFSQMRSSEQARVMDLTDEPAQVKQKARGRVAIFYRAPGAALNRQALKKQLEDKYDYYKVRVKKLRTKGWFRSKGDIQRTIGDSAWMDKTIADRYRLPYTRTRIIAPIDNGRRYSETFFTRSVKQGLNQRFGIDITTLGWINCDRFYNDEREKIEYVVRLGDAADAYATLLIFDRQNAVINGYFSGNEVYFPGVPLGEPVTIVSVGVNTAGKAVYGVEKAVVTKEGLSSINYTEATAPGIKSALQKLDQ